MDKQISIGDLVVAVRGHECLLERVGGIPFTVTGFLNPKGGGWTCTYCEMRSAGPNEVGVLGVRPDRKVTRNSAPIIPISFLKRIPPLGDLEGEKDAADKPITLDSMIKRLRKLVRA